MERLLFKETIAEFMEKDLEVELADELGYSKYDYKNKATDSSRNGYSSKILRTSFRDMEVSVPRNQKGEFEPEVLKKPAQHQPGHCAENPVHVRQGYGHWRY